jgi:hypothetical protein
MSDLRGSTKLGDMSPETLHLAIGAARPSYKLERWWKYGQPAIDRIAAVVNITDPQAAGSIIGGLANLHGNERQITLDVFPYGLPALDGVRVHVNVEEAVR